MRQRPAAQCKLFEPFPAPTAFPAPIEQEVMSLLAQMMEAMICAAGNRTEDGDE